MRVNKKWSKEDLIDVAKSFDERNKFKKSNNAAYSAAQRRGILEEICSHMLEYSEIRMRNDRYWTEERCIEESKKYGSKKEFKKNNLTAYNWCVKYKILDSIFTKKIQDLKEKVRWNKELVMKEALKYDKISTFVVSAKGAYSYAKRHNFFDEIICNMKDFSKQEIYYSDEELKRLIKDAKKYNSRSELYLQNRQLYELLLKKKMIETIFNNKLKEHCVFWDFDKMKTEALKFDTKSQFRKESGGCYSKALDLGIMDEICTHMINIKDERERKFEKEFVEKLKTILRDSSVNYKIDTQKRYERDSQIAILDILLKIDNVFFALELKHDESDWSKNSLNKQLDNYLEVLPKDEIDYLILVSSNGRYGFSEEEFILFVKSKLLTLKNNRKIQKERQILWFK